MANLKKRRHSAICNDCNGNGFLYREIHLEKDRKNVVVQCETCDSEGEIYVHESEIIESYLDAVAVAGDVVKLH